MKLLDTREQKSPQFLFDAIDGLQSSILKSGDYLSVEKHCSYCDTQEEKWDEVTWCGHARQKHYLKGNLVEIKIGTDFGIHTEQLERFQDELYRMRLWQKENPKVDLHAVWLKGSSPQEGMKLFHSLCHQYHVWGHIYFNEYEVVKFLKELDQPSQYIRDECFIKRDHAKVSILAKMIRQFPRISSEKAVALAERINVPMKDWFCFYEEDNQWHVERWIQTIIYDVLGRKKDGSPTKLAKDFITYLEEGE